MTMSERVYILTTKQVSQWKEVLNHCVNYDVYHLPEYHRLAEEQGEGNAILFVYESDLTVIAFPLLIRRVANLPGIETSDYFDTTSVYGYSGPISNNPYPSKDTIKRFNMYLRDYLVGKKVISAFSRLHPFFNQQIYLKYFPEGEIIDIGPTVAIDLTLPEYLQWQKYRSNHKRNIRKLKSEGVSCIHDESWTYLDAFVNIYYSTMISRKADRFYFFDRSYFFRLSELLREHVHLFIALKNEVVLAGGIFTFCNGIIQYHLGGTNPQYRKLAASKLVFDTVRLWGNRVGARMIHLGGGVGGKQDSLFFFKAGFSDARYTFRIWRSIINKEAYNEFLKLRQDWNKAHGLPEINKEYFPAYRSPVAKIKYD